VLVRVFFASAPGPLDSALSVVRPRRVHTCSQLRRCLVVPTHYPASPYLLHQHRMPPKRSFRFQFAPGDVGEGLPNAMKYDDPQNYKPRAGPTGRVDGWGFVSRPLARAPTLLHFQVAMTDPFSHQYPYDKESGDADPDIEKIMNRRMMTQLSYGTWSDTKIEKTPEEQWMAALIEARVRYL
jgi:hypothetical protein